MKPMFSPCRPSGSASGRQLDGLPYLTNYLPSFLPSIRLVRPSVFSLGVIDVPRGLSVARPIAKKVRHARYERNQGQYEYEFPFNVELCHLLVHMVPPIISASCSLEAAFAFLDADCGSQLYIARFAALAAAASITRAQAIKGRTERGESLKSHHSRVASD